MQKDGTIYSDIVGVTGNTYAERKAQLLKQLGFNIKASLFEGLSEIQIDNKARDIILGES